jgi:hypothetical protein
MKQADRDSLRITDQFRGRRGFVYDLRCQGSRLTLCIVPRGSVADSDEWCIEARASHAPDAPIVSEWGPTRIDALRAVGRSWAIQAQQRGLPLFDWEAVAKALTEVRAL